MNQRVFNIPKRWCQEVTHGQNSCIVSSPLCPCLPINNQAYSSTCLQEKTSKRTHYWNTCNQETSDKTFPFNTCTSSPLIPCLGCLNFLKKMKRFDIKSEKESSEDNDKPTKPETAQQKNLKKLNVKQLTDKLSSERITVSSNPLSNKTYSSSLSDKLSKKDRLSKEDKINLTRIKKTEIVNLGENDGENPKGFKKTKDPKKSVGENGVGENGMSENGVGKKIMVKEDVGGGTSDRNRICKGNVGGDRLGKDDAYPNRVKVVVGGDNVGEDDVGKDYVGRDDRENSKQFHKNKDLKKRKTLVVNHEYTFSLLMELQMELMKYMLHNNSQKDTMDSLKLKHDEVSGIKKGELGCHMSECEKHSLDVHKPMYTNRSNHKLKMMTSKKKQISSDTKSTSDTSTSCRRYKTPSIFKSDVSSNKRCALETQQNIVSAQTSMGSSPSVDLETPVLSANSISSRYSVDNLHSVQMIKGWIPQSISSILTSKEGKDLKLLHQRSTNNAHSSSRTRGLKNIVRKDEDFYIDISKFVSNPHKKVSKEKLALKSNSENCSLFRHENNRDTHMNIDRDIVQKEKGFYIDISNFISPQHKKVSKNKIICHPVKQQTLISKNPNYFNNIKTNSCIKFRKESNFNRMQSEKLTDVTSYKEHQLIKFIDRCKRTFEGLKMKFYEEIKKKSMQFDGDLRMKEAQLFLKSHEKSL